MSDLTKNISTVVIPGTLGSPGSPGSPAIPGHYETTTVVIPAARAGSLRYFIWKEGGAGAVELTPAGYGALVNQSPRPPGLFTSRDTNASPERTISTTVYVPTVPAVPPTPAIPATSTATRLAFNLGWTSGAISNATQNSDCSYSFSIRSPAVGVVTGLNDTNTGVGYLEIDYGIYFAKGVATPYENGSQVGSSVTFNSGDVFSVRRIGSTITYAKNGVVFGTSPRSSSGTLFADCSMFSGGDAITGASFTAIPSAASAHASFASLTALASNKTYCTSTTQFASLQTGSGVRLIGSSAASFQPLKTLSSNFAYTNSAASFSPLATDSGSGALTPEYAVSAGSFAYLLTAARVLTGEIAQSSASFQSLGSRSADHAYAEAAVSFAPLEGYSEKLLPPTSISGYAEISAPSPAVYGTGGAGRNVAQVAAPSPNLSAFGGASAELEAPIPTLVISATFAGSAIADLAAPPPTLIATGTVSGTGRFDISPTSPNLVGYGGAVCNITISGRHTIVASGITGGVASAEITCPLFQLTASGATQSYGGANLIAPSPRLGGQLQAYLLAPRATLTAIGTATVTATYEAYAVNLKHTSDTPTDEVTHYTNFPFDKIVRYKNSYFGMNATGLYLLEGTTDAGTPTPFAIETHKTDFDTAEMKTVVALYMGGRVGAAETVSIIAGEKTPNSYSYTTPRGALAQNYRQKFGRGIKSRYYAFAVAGSQEFELDALEPEVTKLTRRI